jgi:hypothetical protein
MEPRPTPYDLVFADDADERFGPIQAALADAGTEPTDRDAFLMAREVVTLVRELRPDDGMGEGIEQLAALVHHAYLFWVSGRPLLTIAPDRLPALLDNNGRPASVLPTPSHSAAVYAQLPERRLWATVVPGESAEPLDGCFIHAAGKELRVLGVFGIRPDRMGFSVVEAAGERPGKLARPDGSPVFAPALPGGAAAGLHSLIGTEELLELGWRTWTA